MDIQKVRLMKILYALNNTVLQYLMENFIMTIGNRRLMCIWYQFIHSNGIHFLSCNWNQSIANKRAARKTVSGSFLSLTNIGCIKKKFPLLVSSRLGYVIYLYLHILNTTFGNFTCFFFATILSLFCTFQSTTLLAYMNMYDKCYEISWFKLFTCYHVNDNYKLEITFWICLELSETSRFTMKK